MSLSAELSCLQSSHGAEREAAFATLEKQLMCPICLEIFNKPVVILPCQHNLCRKCANELYQPSLFQARTTMLVNSGRFRCPSCRHEVVLDRHGVYGLQRNLLVENIIDIYKQELNSAPSPLPPPPPPTTTTQTPTCSDHEGEKLNIYCVTCQVPTCSLCKVFGAHQSCQVAPLADIYQQQKDKLSEGVTSLVAFSDRIQSIISELEETCRNIEENCKTQKQGVCDKFNHLFSILEDRQQVMKQRISCEEEEKTTHTQLLTRNYGDSIEANNKLMESALSSMEEPDMAAFIQNSTELITKVVTATTSFPSETLKPGYENLSNYRINFNEQQRALESIDFIKVLEEVPEEPEVDPEPAEPKELESEQNQESTVQNLEAFVEPDKRPEPELMSPPVEPIQLAVQETASTPPAPDLVRDSVAAGELMLLEADEPDFNDVGPGQIQVERKEKREDTQKEDEACAAPHPVIEENICEDQEGMSTQQAVTLLFYLLAFLIILQRVWDYIGCFICT
ncbi:tripartite motif containing 101 [Melanotaenia boesemani]|uniref:tripartite motif containing 101 n=1 Tax=Melanotaenia boesemani TaxID=1250792 RepID=UPI001C04636C|nr:tripartite motif containing 101 [Melanotaenia boesemani]